MVGVGIYSEIMEGIEMIISRNYGRRLVREGKARIEGLTADPGLWPNGVSYVILQRLDYRGRGYHWFDHYPATARDEKELG
jgi:hypothetical protein